MIKLGGEVEKWREEPVSMMFGDDGQVDQVFCFVVFHIVRVAHWAIMHLSRADDFLLSVAVESGYAAQNIKDLTVFAVAVESA